MTKLTNALRTAVVEAMDKVYTHLAEESGYLVQKKKLRPAETDEKMAKTQQKVKVALEIHQRRDSWDLAKLPGQEKAEGVLSWLTIGIGDPKLVQAYLGTEDSITQVVAAYQLLLSDMTAEKLNVPPTIEKEGPCVPGGLVVALYRQYTKQQIPSS